MGLSKIMRTRLNRILPGSLQWQGLHMGAVAAIAVSYLSSSRMHILDDSLFTQTLAGSYYPYVTQDK